MINIIGNTIGRYKSSGTQEQYDEALEAVIDKATLEGYDIPNGQCLSEISNFIAKRRADGSLDIMDFLYITAIKNGGSLLDLFSSIDYKNPERQFEPVNDPDFSDLGWAGDGVASYVELSYNPSIDAVNYQRNNAAIGLFVTENGTVGAGLFGYLSTGSGVRIISTNNNQQRINSGTNTLPAAVNMSGEGYRANDRALSTHMSTYVGTTKTDHAVVSESIINSVFCVGRSSSSFSNARWGLLYTGASLTEQQHNNIKADFETYLIESGITT